MWPDGTTQTFVDYSNFTLTWRTSSSNPTYQTIFWDRVDASEVHPRELEGAWTVRWRDGRTEWIAVADGTFTCFGTTYRLRNERPVFLEWNDGTVQTLHSISATTLTWTTTNRRFPQIFWGRTIAALPSSRPPAGANQPAPALPGGRPPPNEVDTKSAPAGDDADTQPRAECIICLSAPVQATFIHGDTGHTACCMPCAQALKQRGAVCPVCRQPVSAVIRNFF